MRQVRKHYLRIHDLNHDSSDENYFTASIPIKLSKPVLKEQLHQYMQSCAIYSDESLRTLFDQVINFR